MNLTTYEKNLFTDHLRQVRIKELNKIEGSLSRIFEIRRLATL